MNFNVLAYAGHTLHASGCSTDTGALGPSVSVCLYEWRQHERVRVQSHAVPILMPDGTRSTRLSTRHALHSLHTRLNHGVGTPFNAPFSCALSPLEAVATPSCMHDALLAAVCTTAAAANTMQPQLLAARCYWAGLMPLSDCPAGEKTHFEVAAAICTADNALGNHESSLAMPTSTMVVLAHSAPLDMHHERLQPHFGS